MLPYDERPTQTSNSRRGDLDPPLYTTSTSLHVSNIIVELRMERARNLGRYVDHYQLQYRI